ncbi:1,4-beta-glucanase [Nakamurella sp. YIM 132087]|uniref:Glucanase n=1 Tax=Nakamurella alba TaxID=2665158 RepID=A0A7K1FML5_9ACTN|nr:1,4-beta-glucanase [Nakamurella alba]
MPADGNPFAGRTLFADPHSTAAQAGAAGSPAGAKLAAIPQAKWFVDSDTSASVDLYMDQAAAAGRYPVAVLYAVPGRDCGSYSAGGRSSGDSYLDWVREVRAGIADRPVAVVVEPDALTNGGCGGDTAATEERLDLLGEAVGILAADPTTAVYIDAGHQEWLPPAEAARRLTEANVAQARGFSLNVSNFYRTADEIAYGEKVSTLLGGKHYVLDTSRNGSGPAPAEPENWCNPAGRTLGTQPTADTAGAHADAYLWIKHPGESDGTCKSGPYSGYWYDSWATDIVSRSWGLD